MRAGHDLSAIGFRLCTLTILSLGCLDTTRPTEPPAAPPAPAPVPPPAAPVPPPTAPPLSLAGVVYDRVSHSFVPGASHYVFYDDSTFSLRYEAYGGFEYPGKFSREDSEITFHFDGWSVMGPWLAHGTVRGDSLIVKYNDVMVYSDFEDGTYVRSSGQ